ncbi:cell division protein FtsK [Candidatus Fermentibacteria bacterium]|nr:MAG: cell division protein FtsK [Candidatus Fermentibacteria bacterium]
MARKKKKAGRLRASLFLLLTAVSLTTIVALTFPSEGFLQNTGTALKGAAGFLSAFIPLFTFLAGAMILRLSFARQWIEVSGAVLICCFFLAGMVAMILCRFSPNLLFVPGGALAGRLVLAMESIIGGVVTWIVLFILFLLSIVIFTGWSIADDINALLSRRKRSAKPEKQNARPSATPVSTNPWGQSAVEASPASNPVHQTELPSEPELFAEHASAVETETRPVRKTGIFTLPKEKPVKKKPSSAKPPVPIEAAHGDSEEKYRLPGQEFLTLPAPSERVKQTKAEIEQRADLLVSKLSDFGVDSTITEYCSGPVLTRYELTPGPGIKVNRILNLSDDLAMALAAKRIRILAPIPGKGAVGIEVPNRNPETVYLREIINHLSREKIPVALGKGLEGDPFIADLTDMPHLLIAGATGSGKSVCVHAIISTILMTRTPYQVRLAMVDPKMLELSAYKGIPHLWAPVVIQADKAKYLLEALVREMEERYSLLARTGVRNIRDYNLRFGSDQVEEHLPYIVVVIDELADLIMVSAREVEPPIARLAQMARAVGIHLVVATQRPSVDVITGMIKANFPSRIAFNVQSKTDSRTILDQNGAEKLLGKGDMLFIPSGAPEAIRIHGSFISTEETRALVEYWKEQPEMAFEYELPKDSEGNLYDPGELNYDDPLLEEVKKAVIVQQRASVSMVQRQFRVGYARAGKLIDMLEKQGVVGPHVGSKPRQVLLQPEPDEEEQNES